MWLAIIGGYVAFSLLTFGLCRAATEGDREQRSTTPERTKPRRSNVIPISNYRRLA